MKPRIVSLLPLVLVAAVFYACPPREWFARAPDVEAIHRENALHARERAAALPPGFVVPDSFPQLVAALEKITGSRPEPFVVDGEPPVTTKGVELEMRSDTLAKALADTAALLARAKGFHLFSDGRSVIAMPTGDPYATIQIVGTNGNLFGPSTKKIVEWLRALEQEQPFVITGIGTDYVAGRFTAPLRDPATLARRFYKFCPDIVTQGTRSVRALEVELRESLRLYCWWD